MYISDGNPSWPKNIFVNCNCIDTGCLILLEDLRVPNYFSLPNVFNPQRISLGKLILSDAPESL